MLDFGIFILGSAKMKDGALTGILSVDRPIMLIDYNGLKVLRESADKVIKEMENETIGR